MPVCTHPHLEGEVEGKTERVRDKEREFDPVARNSIRGDDETDRLGLHFSEKCAGSPPT